MIMAHLKEFVWGLIDKILMNDSKKKLVYCKKPWQEI